MESTTFRDVMAQWPSGVTVVTTLDASGAPHGMTASSFSSVSLDPPLVSICLTKTLYSHELIERSGVFGINVMAKGQADVARRFAGMEPGVVDRFAGEVWTTAETGVPLLDSSLGWFDCRVVHAYPGGDHTIFVGEVVAGRAAGRSAPLLFHSRGWGQFADVLPDVATLCDSGAVRALRERSTEDEAARVAREIARAGVRVRVADLVTGSAGPVIGAGECGPEATLSAVVADRGQADRMLAGGVDLVEFDVDPSDRSEVSALLDTLTGIEGVSVVNLQDAFASSALDAVLDTVVNLTAAGVAEIGLIDSDGRATPLEVRGLLQEVVARARPIPLRMRLHDRDRLGLVKAITALKSGIRHFDSTVAGMGEAVPTEDLIRLLEEVEVSTPVESLPLVDLARSLRGAVTPLTSPSSVPLQAGTPHTVGAAG